MAKETERLVHLGNVRVGMARAAFTDCGRLLGRDGSPVTDAIVHDDVYATAVALSDGSRKVVLFGLDYGSMCVQAMDAIRRRVASRLDMPIRQVITTMTHTHAGLSTNGLDKEKFADRLVQVAQAALDSAAPVEMAYAVTDVGIGFNLNRRIELTDGLGAHCVMFNTDCVTRDGRVEATEQLKKLVAEWGGKWEETEMSRRPNYADGPTDRTLHLVVLRKLGGPVIGAIVRFSGHPVVVSRYWIGHTISRDVPGYVVDEVMEKLGAPVMYLTGPSGDQRMYCQEYSFGEAERIGKALAGKVLELTTDLKFEPVVDAALAEALVKLPIRKDAPRTPAEVEQVVRELDVQIAQAHAGGAPPAKIKQLMDQRARQAFMTGMLNQTLVTAEELAAGVKPIEFPFLRLGEVGFACLPGEPFHKIGLGIVEGLSPHKVVTAQLANGTVTYVPLAEEVAKGGYETTWSVTAPGTDSIMVREQIRLGRKAFSES